MRVSYLVIAFSLLVGAFLISGQSSDQARLRSADGQCRKLFIAGLLQSILDWLLSKIFKIPPNGFKTIQPAQMAGTSYFVTTPLLTIGESSPNGYQFPGVPDGLAAFVLREKIPTVRILGSHEIPSSVGYAYILANGATLRGSRISYMDIDVRSRKLLRAGLAYDTIYSRAGKAVLQASDLIFSGLERFCSARGWNQGENGFVDDIYMTGEETFGGTAFALDVKNNKLWAAPALGRAAFENFSSVNIVDATTKVALLIGDDRGGAGLLLYVGVKTPGTDFLDRNGLKNGNLYAWKPNTSGILSPQDWKGTGNTLQGRFVEIDYYRPDLKGNGEYDELGYAIQSKQDALLAAAGAFKFSRPEDLHTNPNNDRQVVFASTGRSSLFNGTDSWGTIYLLDFTDPVNLIVDITIMYDCDDAGGGVVEGPDYGIRNPDNLVWAKDGFIYVQEDKAFSSFGQTSGKEASIWKLDPVSRRPTRIAEMNRNAVPTGQTDVDVGSIGAWESSGIIDVTSEFNSGKTLLFFDVMAHGLKGGAIEQDDLVEGGQYLFLEFV